MSCTLLRLISLGERQPQTLHSLTKKIHARDRRRPRSYTRCRRRNETHCVAIAYGKTQQAKGGGISVVHALTPNSEPTSRNLLTLLCLPPKSIAPQGRGYLEGATSLPRFLKAREYPSPRIGPNRLQFLQGVILFPTKPNEDSAAGNGVSGVYIDADTTLDISTDGEKLTIGPAKPSERRRKFEVAQAKAHQRFSGTFRKLAE